MIERSRCRLGSFLVGASLVAVAALPFAAPASAEGNPLAGADVTVGPDGTLQVIGAAFDPATLQRSALPRTQASSAGTLDIDDLVGGSGPGELTQAELDALVDSLPADQVPPQASSRAVIGPDGRVQISNVTDSPFIQTPFLVLQEPGSTGGYICTGWLFSDYSLATAAHCLYGDNGWRTGIRAYFGFSGTTYVATCTANLAYISQEWINTRAVEQDWGVVQLNCNAGAVLGSFGWRTATDTPGAFAVTGYPGDKHSLTAGYTMWSHSGTITAHSDYNWKYQIDTAGGQSGAPVWRQEAAPCGNCVVGIHTYGGFPDPTSNGGTRLHPAVRSALTLFSSWVVP